MPETGLNGPPARPGACEANLNAAMTAMPSCCCRAAVPEAWPACLWLRPPHLRELERAVDESCADELDEVLRLEVDAHAAQ